MVTFELLAALGEDDGCADWAAQRAGRSMSLAGGCGGLSDGCGKC